MSCRALVSGRAAGRAKKEPRTSSPPGPTPADIAGACADSDEEREGLRVK